MGRVVSRTVIVSTLAIVLMMLMVALPAEGTYSADPVPEEAIELTEGVPQESEHGLWSWDHNKCILRIEDGLCIKGFTISMKTTKELEVILNGTSSVGAILVIGNGGDITFNGGGSIKFNQGANAGIVVLNNSISTRPLVTMENISMEITEGGMGITVAKHDLKIRDCPEMKITAEGGIVVTFGNLTIENTNLRLTTFADEEEDDCAYIAASGNDFSILGIDGTISSDDDLTYISKTGETTGQFVPGETIAILPPQDQDTHTMTVTGYKPVPIEPEEYNKKVAVGDYFVLVVPVSERLIEYINLGKAGGKLNKLVEDKDYYLKELPDSNGERTMIIFDKSVTADTGDYEFEIHINKGRVTTGEFTVSNAQTSDNTLLIIVIVAIFVMVILSLLVATLFRPSRRR